MSRVEFIKEVVDGIGYVALDEDLRICSTPDSRYLIDKEGYSILLHHGGACIPFTTVESVLAYIMTSRQFEELDVYDLGNNCMYKKTPWGEVEYEDGVYRLCTDRQSYYLGDNAYEAQYELSLIALEEQYA